MLLGHYLCIDESGIVAGVSALYHEVGQYAVEQCAVEFSACCKLQEVVTVEWGVVIQLYDDFALVSLYRYQRTVVACRQGGTLCEGTHDGGGVSVLGECS